MHKGGLGPQLGQPAVGGLAATVLVFPPPLPWDAFGIVLPGEKHRLLLQALWSKGFSLRRQPLPSSRVLWGQVCGRAPSGAP